MPTIIDLPNELLHTICVYAQSDGNSKSTAHAQNGEINNATLLSLCRACRVLKDIAQGILYRSVSGTLDEDGSLLPLWRLTETILMRPELARRVKNLSIQLNPQASINLAITKTKFDSGLQRSRTRPWLHQSALRTLWAYEVVHVLLARLSNIETLYITIVGFDLRVFSGRASWEVLDQLPKSLYVSTVGLPNDQPLKHLRHVEVAHRKVQAYVPLMHVGEFEFVFLLSSAKSVCIKRRQFVSLQGAPVLPPALVSKLTNLELREYCIHLRSLDYLCSAAHNLKRFAFVTLDPLSLHRGSLLGHPELDHDPLIRQPTPMQFLHALGTWAKTLEYLELDFYDWFQPGFEALWGHDGTDAKQRYPSFRHFKSLEVLNIEHERVCPPTELPESLLGLTLSHKPNKPCLIDDPLHYPRIQPGYRQLIQENICPKLRCVQVGRFYPFRYMGTRVYDWRHISKKRWEDFVSLEIDFSDLGYKFEEEGLEEQEEDGIQETWWDPWWKIWRTQTWPKELKDDLIECLFREVSR